MSVRTKVTSLVAASGLAVGLSLIAATPASAAGSGCTVNRYKTGGSSTYNGGSARCASLTNGSVVHVLVYCSNGSSYVGPWVSRSNTDSKAACNPGLSAAVDYYVR